ncbi:SDR family NAD(P)-dependent oxidoreductase [Skermanella pratensis]|uniref:SDR family NAD(P)-dependent oxidoreductase n=1 Tax=Skermanella pratensis TaxID=2233999 RepID=UPI001300F72E|nr:SDR family NAD(P)-dependent oxidoreductase [Skermanella pratensis]
MTYANNAPHKPGLVLITGATGGFGGAFARRFAAIGSRLVLAGRRADRLKALRDELETEVHTVEVDVRDRRAIEQAFGSLPSGFAEVETLINNAGLALGADSAQKSDPDDWETMIDTNDKGLVFCTRALLPGMIERGRGHVVNIGSTAGNYPYPGGHVYCASKAFVKQFSLALRADLQGTGVRVTNVEPGMVETDFSLVRFKGDAEKAGKVYADTTPLTADDVAEAVFWAATLPPHFNVNRLEIMPTTQAFGPLSIHRSK